MIRCKNGKGKRAMKRKRRQRWRIEGGGQLESSRGITLKAVCRGVSSPEVTPAYRPGWRGERGQTNNLFPQTSFTLIGSLSEWQTKRRTRQKKKFSRLKDKTSDTQKHQSNTGRKLDGKIISSINQIGFDLQIIRKWMTSCNVSVLSTSQKLRSQICEENR